MVRGAGQNIDNAHVICISGERSHRTQLTQLTELIEGAVTAHSNPCIVAEAPFIISQSR
jgi:hypothetical protein